MTTKEQIANLRPVCKSCVEDTRKSFQKSGKIDQLKSGHNVKAPLKQGEYTEHVWIKVEKIMKHTIIGKINNTPMLVNNYKRNDSIMINKSDISDIFELQ